MGRRAVFVDTSVLCEILDIPGKAQDPDAFKTEFAQRVRDGQTLVLPLAAVVETGNHVAQLSGSSRRSLAEKLVRVLDAVAQGESGWAPLEARWDAGFLVDVLRGATPVPPWIELATQGIGMGDATIIAEAREYRSRTSRVEVEIWSKDQRLSAWSAD